MSQQARTAEELLGRPSRCLRCSYQALPYLLLPRRAAPEAGKRLIMITAARFRAFTISYALYRPPSAACLVAEWLLKSMLTPDCARKRRSGTYVARQAGLTGDISIGQAAQAQILSVPVVPSFRRRATFPAIVQRRHGFAAALATSEWLF